LKALILAAGYAKRLWPLTKNRPKPLLEVKGKPIVEHLIAGIKEIPEIDEILVVTNEKFSITFEDWAKEYDCEIPIKVINDLTTSNEDRKGAVGDMQYVIEEIDFDDDLMVIAGDNLFEYKLIDFYNFFKEKKASIVACKDMVNKEEVKEKFGVVETNSDLEIIGFEEKPVNPKSALASTACYLFTKKDVKKISDYLNAKNPPDNAGDFIKWLSKQTNVFAFLFKENWFDIGSFENLGKAREEFDS